MKNAHEITKYAYAIRARTPLAKSTQENTFTYLRCSATNRAMRETVCAVCRKPHINTEPVICARCRFRIHPECGELNIPSRTGEVGLVCQCCLSKE